jgi:hypothetical protein
MPRISRTARREAQAHSREAEIAGLHPRSRRGKQRLPPRLPSAVPPLHLLLLPPDPAAARSVTARIRGGGDESGGAGGNPAARGAELGS